MREKKMGNHSHNFVETYTGPVAFGFDRPTDESTVIYYLQKFSDDAVMEHVIPKTSNSDLEEIFNLISRILKQNLSEPEYHRLFLKDHDPQ
jgi:uncharacterized membrane protein